MNLDITLLCLALILVAASCGHAPGTAEPNSYVDADSPEEMNRDQLLDYYAKLRAQRILELNQRLEEKRPPSSSKIKTLVPKKVISPNPPPTTHKLEASEELPSPEQQEEIEVGIEQNRSWFCLSQEGNQRFPSKEACHSFTEQFLERCKANNHFEKWIKCFRSALKAER